MIDPSHASVRVQAAGQHGSPGGFFHVRAIAALPGGFWTVEYGGATRAVRTAAALQPGFSYTGVFVQKKGFVEFLPRPGAFAPDRQTGALPSRLPEAGTREYSRFVLSLVFSRAGVPLPQGPALEEILRFVHRESRREVVSRSALALRCEAKGLSLPADDYETLHAVFEGYSGGGGEGGGDRRQKQGGSGPEGDDRDAAPPAAPASGGEEGREGVLLRLFNHTKSGDEAWVVYPYRCTVGDLAYSGSLRVLYSAEGKNAKKYVLAVRGKDGQWHFAWNPPKSALKIYFSPSPGASPLCGPAARPEPRGFFRAWARKFRKHGLYSDDIIYTGENFDGFSEELKPGGPVDEMA
ncbi:MAG: hypothetical protein LBT33_07880 [Spirochaetia bacterium]|jgi:hypothetical protein|nr:hypothetical protein [Spirochaetia bacterium]